MQMIIRDSAIALGLSIFFSAGPSYSQTQTQTASSDADELFVTLSWTDDTSRGVPPGVTARLHLWPDHMTVSSGRATQPEAENYARECTKNLKVEQDGNMSDETAAKFMDCEDQSARMNMVSASSHAVMLPLISGSRKCDETRLSSGSYRICAALLEKTVDVLRMEYEEDVDYGGKLFAYRARFNLTLYGDRSIAGCKVTLTEAFSFNPRQPAKLIPFVRTTVQICNRSPSSAGEEARQIRKGLTR